MNTKIERVKCSVCGKITCGRLPRNSREHGDGTFWYPRWHDNGNCDGNYQEGILVKVDEKGREIIC